MDNINIGNCRQYHCINDIIFNKQQQCINDNRQYQWIDIANHNVWIILGNSDRKIGWLAGCLSFIAYQPLRVIQCQIQFTYMNYIWFVTIFLYEFTFSL